MPISKLEKKFILEQLSPVSEELQRMLVEFTKVNNDGKPVQENLIIFSADEAQDRYWNCIHKLNKVMEDVENS